MFKIAKLPGMLIFITLILPVVRGSNGRLLKTWISSNR